LTTLTLRRDRGGVGQEHYRVLDGDRRVGRIYKAGNHRWFWGLGYEVTEPANPPYGHEPTREAAMSKFKTAYLALPRPES
jgi:hypothetical protein